MEATEAEINEAFKTLPIEKFASPSQLRASFSLGLFLNQTEMVSVSGAFDAQKVGFKLFSYLLQFVDESLFVVTAEELHEAIRGEVRGTVEDSSCNAIELALEISEKDPGFSPAISSVTAQLDKARQTASEVFKKACDIALTEAIATAEVLVEEYLKVNPTFTTMLDESTPSEFKLLSFLYEGLVAVGSGEADDGFDEDEPDQYDA